MDIFVAINFDITNNFMIIYNLVQMKRETLFFCYVCLLFLDYDVSFHISSI